METGHPTKEEQLKSKTTAFVIAANKHGYPELAEMAQRDDVSPKQLQDAINDTISEHDDFDALRSLLETATRMQWLVQDIDE